MILSIFKHIESGLLLISVGMKGTINYKTSFNPTVKLIGMTLDFMLDHFHLQLRQL